MMNRARARALRNYSRDLSRRETRAKKTWHSSGFIGADLREQARSRESKREREREREREKGVTLPLAETRYGNVTRGGAGRDR
jgi:hypothetical protein